PPPPRPPRRRSPHGRGVPPAHRAGDGEEHPRGDGPPGSAATGAPRDGRRGGQPRPRTARGARKSGGGAAGGVRTLSAADGVRALARIGESTTVNGSTALRPNATRTAPPGTATVSEGAACWCEPVLGSRLRSTAIRGGSRGGRARPS